MPSFSRASSSKLSEVHPDLQEVLYHAIAIVDFSVLEGARSKERQKELYDAGHSKTMNSKHRIQGDGYAHAVDIAPYPIDWDDYRRFYFLAGVVFAVAKRRGVRIRWGGDWDSDKDFSDQTFNDLVHFEIVVD